MFVWSTDRIYWECHTNHKTGEQQTIGVSCTCLLCGPVKPDIMLVRFDELEPHETPRHHYPRVGICQECIGRAQRAADHFTVERGMVRIGSPYSCTHCRDRVQPVVWFNTKSRLEQFICARCLVAAQKQFLVEAADLQDRWKSIDTQAS